MPIAGATPSPESYYGKPIAKVDRTDTVVSTEDGWFRTRQKTDTTHTSQTALLTDIRSASPDYMRARAEARDQLQYAPNGLSEAYAVIEDAATGAHTIGRMVDESGRPAGIAGGGWMGIDHQYGSTTVTPVTPELRAIVTYGNVVEFTDGAPRTVEWKRS